jgi:glyoxylase-like metal-dependent hydrolase (beta-lactamase superfamily II)
MSLAPPESIEIVDGHYFIPERAGAYLVHAGEEAAFIDNIIRFSIPYLLETLEKQGLKPEQVRYVIVTHVHLDHSGGTAELIKHCPNATVLCHPKAGAHIIDPSKLIAGARAVYPTQFDDLYGEIEPIDESRVRIIEDMESVELGSRTLTFYDTPGHARHHHAILDSQTNMMIAGDAFGLRYQQLQGGSSQYMTYVCAPPTFEPNRGRESVQKILDANPDHIGVTHYGMVKDIQQGAEQVIRSIDKFEEVSKRASETDLEGDALLEYCLEYCLNVIKEELKISGLDIDDSEVMRWATHEHRVTSQGVTILAQRLRKA